MKIPSTLVVASLLFFGASPARGDQAEVVGRALTVRGEVNVKQPHGLYPLVRGTRLLASDVVKTGSDGALRILLTNRTIIDVGSRTELNLASLGAGEKKKKKSLGVKLVVGRIWAFVSKVFKTERRFEVETDNAVAGVRGTEFVVTVDSNGETLVQVLEGEVEMSPLGSELLEVLGPMASGSFAGEGPIIVGAFTQSELGRARSDTRPGKSIGSSQNKQLKQMYGPVEPDRKPFEDDRPPTPNLESEPGVGLGTIRGQIVEGGQL